MKKKLIFRVLFEKKKVLVMFFIMCTFLIVFTSVQTVLNTYNADTMQSTPDFAFHGTVYQSMDGSYPFIGYNDTGLFREKAQEIAGDDAVCYGVVYRSLYNYYDQLTNIGFSGALYGLPDECLEEQIAPFVSQGRLPEKGQKEAVVGYYFAQHFEIGIGDPVPQAITLSKTWTEADIDSYTVCGILTENATDYFNGSALISRETFEAMNGAQDENMVLGYLKNTEHYEDQYIAMNNISQEYRVPEGRLHYKQKEFSRTGIILNIALIVVMSIAMLTAVISYLMKGITPKVGLMKATGISTTYILKTFLTGVFCVFLAALATGVLISSVLLGAANNYVRNFFEFEVHRYQLSGTAFALDGFEFLFILLYAFVVIYIKCKRITPKEAMTRTV
ncbi:MAG: hypothetical protein IKZ98_07050 [Clostridia bacterium]|nr:hypothetical protein [Clostridia bacterium]